MRIVVFFSGTGTNLKSIINHQEKYGYEVCSCFTNNPRAGGIDICKDHSLDCKVIDNNSFTDRVEFDKKIDEYLNTIEPDFIILAGYMRILSSFLVNNWEGQIVNIHPSLLPKYPGLNTHQRALDAGDKYHGTTIHFVTSELDDGPIIRQESFKIEPSDNPDSLMERIKEIEHKIYPETISFLNK
jgi:phosphoribosylglycinamide formyltransferase-1